jgi:2-oxoglutarate ferredoxin oxidoreductase subunit gamma
MSQEPTTLKLQRILMAGSGGQGIVLLGKLLATAALRTSPHLTFFPCYGAEVRGGTSNCQVILSADEISSPLAEQHDALVLMNQESADRFLPRLAPGGLAVLNSSLCQTAAAPDRLLVAATAEADRLGDQRVANLVMLGALIGRRPLATPTDIEVSLRSMLEGKPRTIVDLNVAAFRRGLALGAA